MELNFNSVENIANLNASAAFPVDSGKVFKDDVCISPVIIDNKLKQQVEGFLLTLIVFAKNRTKRTDHFVRNSFFCCFFCFLCNIFAACCV